MLLSYNKAVDDTEVMLKSRLLEKTLKGLDNEKINSFFGYVKDNFHPMPSDAEFKRILRNNYHRFGKKDKSIQIENSNRIDPDWMKEFSEKRKMVIYGKISPDEAKKELGL